MGEAARFRNLNRISGEVREAIVFVEEPSSGGAAPESADILAEMRPFMVDVPDVDDSRESILFANGRRMILLDTNILTRSPGHQS